MILHPQLYPKSEGLFGLRLTEPPALFMCGKVGRRQFFIRESQLRLPFFILVNPIFSRIQVSREANC